MTLKVDPGMLEQFARAVAGAAREITEVDLTTPFAESQTAAPGTDLSNVCVTACDAGIAALQNLCLRLSEVAEIAHGTAGNYDVTESDFVGMLSELDIPR
ncbi:hypothetical protein [Rhodococcus marinonascens]|uniref:hypothetical protein n=1 Tax=Rhodococcus marinonascens TaxID=38311 RepID=UPI000AF00313|nr:hypothetical protein [Rhodococcus marinonascens]